LFLNTGKKKIGITAICQKEESEDKMNNDKKNTSPCNSMANNKVTRVFRKIDKKDILDFEQYNILPIGTDEIFVKIKDSNTHYISNYGRCISITNKARLLAGNMNTNGKLSYAVPVWVNDERVWKNYVADKLVVEHFFDCELNTPKDYIWHSGYNKEDNYYLNLYVMELKPYKMLKKFVQNGGIDTEDKILEIANSKAMNEPTVLGVGYWGMPDVDVHDNTYIRWCNMLGRCYSEKYQKRQSSYVDCSVADEWHNFSNYKKWVEENYYTVDDEPMELDKDILHKGNTVYSPDNCIFVPKSINSLFVNAKASRGEYPVGIDKMKQGFRVRLMRDGKQEIIGYYDNIVDAFDKYKEEKEKLIQEVAEKYKDKIPQKLYDAMMNWIVEYDD